MVYLCLVFSAFFMVWLVPFWVGLLICLLLLMPLAGSSDLSSLLLHVLFCMDYGGQVTWSKGLNFMCSLACFSSLSPYFGSSVKHAILLWNTALFLFPSKIGKRQLLYRKSCQNLFSCLRWFLCIDMFWQGISFTKLPHEYLYCEMLEIYEEKKNPSKTGQLLSTKFGLNFNWFQAQIFFSKYWTVLNFKCLQAQVFG